MLQLSSMVLNRPILSLRIGRPVATTVAAIINPDNLKIEGFHCLTTDRKQLILLSQDIRDLLPQGIIINDDEVLTERSELVRLEKLLKLNFDVLGKLIETTTKHKIGKVNDYATEAQTMYIQKLYVSQSILKSFSGGSLGIDRSQIVEITDNKIIINDLESKVPASAAVPA